MNLAFFNINKLYTFLNLGNINYNINNLMILMHFMNIEIENKLIIINILHE